MVNGLVHGVNDFELIRPNLRARPECYSESPLMCSQTSAEGFFLYSQIIWEKRTSNEISANRSCGFSMTKMWREYLLAKTIPLEICCFKLPTKFVRVTVNQNSFNWVNNIPIFSPKQCHQSTIIQYLVTIQTTLWLS